MGKSTESVLFERERSAGKFMRLSLTEMNGHTFINLRHWYRDGEQLLPSKEGVTLNSPELAEELAEVLKAAAKGLREALEKGVGKHHSKVHL